jgi:hypothetical protein
MKFFSPGLRGALLACASSNASRASAIVEEQHNSVLLVQRHADEQRYAVLSKRSFLLCGPSRRHALPRPGPPIAARA